MAKSCRIDEETIAEKVPVSDMVVDAYQGHVNKKLVEHIANNWNDDAAGAVILNLRKDGVYAVVDGQHRVLAARIKGITTLPALVFIEKSRDEEARLFVMLNKKHNVLPMDRFRANLVAGCQDEKNVHRALQEVGMDLALTGGWRSDFIHHIQCVGSLMDIYRSFGLPHFKTVVGTIGAAYKGYDSPRAYVSEAFGGLSQFIWRYPNADLKRVIQKLSERAPEVVLGMSDMKKERGMDRSMSWGKALTSLYNIGYRRSSKYYLAEEGWSKKIVTPLARKRRAESELVQANLKRLIETNKPTRFKKGHKPYNLKAAAKSKKEE